MAAAFGIAFVLIGTSVLLGAVILIGLILAMTLGTERTGLHPRAIAARWVGFSLGLLVMVALVMLPGSRPLGIDRLSLGVPAMLGPVVGAAVLLLALVIGELTMPPADQRRYGSLVARRAASLLPPGAILIVSLALASFAAITVAGSVLGSPDDRGHEGRELAVVLRGGEVAATAGPFPGTWYAVPAGVAMVGLLLLAVLAILVVTRRRSSDDGADALLRRRTAVAVLGAVSIPAGILALGFSLAAGGALGSLRATVVGEGERWTPPGGLHALEILVWVCGPIGLVTALAGAVMACCPALLARRSPRVQR